jgi:hypothetical protein
VLKVSRTTLIVYGIRKDEWAERKIQWHAPAWTACGHTCGTPALPGHVSSVYWSLWDSSNLVKALNSSNNCIVSIPVTIFSVNPSFTFAQAGKRIFLFYQRESRQEKRFAQSLLYKRIC